MLSADLTLDRLERALRRDVEARRLKVDIARLRSDVLTGRYTPLPTSRRTRRKRDGSQRVLEVPHPRDRVLQRAVLDALGPRLDSASTPNVHGYRAGRSPRTALEHLERQVGRQPWIELVQADIRSLFDNLDHDLLLAAVRWACPCDRLAEWLVSIWATAHGCRGIGQGNPLSPALANLYLARYLDPVVDSEVDAWIRYGDDLTTVRFRRDGRIPMLMALDRAARSAGLELAPGKTAVAGASSATGVTVLGTPVTVVRAVPGPGFRVAIGPSTRLRAWGTIPTATPGDLGHSRKWGVPLSRLPAWWRSLKT